MKNTIAVFVALLVAGSALDSVRAQDALPVGPAGPDLDSALERLDALVERAGRIRFDATFLSPGAAQSALSSRRPNAITDWVGENIAFEPYAGRVRGARGALFSRSGNSIDVALLVAALLEEAGMGWRLAHAQLADEQASALLATIVPRVSTEGVEADAELFEPGTTRWRRRLVADHWWVEAEGPGGTWTAIDPLFPGLGEGATAAEPAERFEPREIPSGFSNTATIRIIAREGMRPQQNVLTYSADIADLSYRNLTLTFVPEGSRNIRPALRAGTEVVEGTPFERSVAERIWMEIEFGFGTSAWRVSRPLRSPEDALDAFSEGVQVFSVLFLPGWVGPDYYGAVSGTLLEELGPRLRDAVARIREGGETLGESQQLAMAEALSSFTGLMALSFAQASDETTLGLAAQMGVRGYYERPRIIIGGAMARRDGLAFQLDLRDDGIEAIPFAGAPERMVAAFQVMRGRMESALADDVLSALTGLPALAPSRLLNGTAADGAALTSVPPTNLRALDRLSWPAGVLDRARDDAAGSGVVLTPRDLVEVAGGQRYAWWLVESASGQPVAVLDDGLRGSVAGFLANPDLTATASPLPALDVAAQLLTSAEALFEGVLDQVEHGRHVRDQACAAMCDLSALSDGACGDAAAADLASCTSGAGGGGDDPLGLGLSCGEMIDNFRCGTLIGRAVLRGDVRVRVESGSVFSGPWPDARPGLQAPGCHCQ